MFNPLNQFEINFITFYKEKYPIDTATVYSIILLLSVRLLFGMVSSRTKIVALTWQNFFEDYYRFIFNMVKQQLGSKGTYYFPLMYTLFTYIVLSNLMGMMLYSLTLTSHAVITFYIGFSLFIGIVYTAIREQGDKFVETFIPSGAPSFLLPPLIVIEVISYFSRPLSLSIRLFANMLSGHALLYILSGFFFSIAKKNLLAAIFPAVLIVLIVGLEVMIAVLQAYVFVVLICIYLNDSLSGAH